MEYDNSIKQFQQLLQKSEHLCVLTGAGASADSGVPTFRGNVSWRGYDNTDLANPTAFRDDPSLVWEFYHWRRQIVRKCQPNLGHYALVAIERIFREQGKKFSLLSQNTDGLHSEAGSQSCLNLHGSIWNVCRATDEGFRDPSKDCWQDRRQPLVAALDGTGDPDPSAQPANIPTEHLPHDEQGYLLRPGVIWYGEHLDTKVIEAANQALNSCDVFVSIGTSQVTYPAAGYIRMAQYRGVPVAEFNLHPTGAIIKGLPNNFEFQGRAAQLVPHVLGVEQEPEVTHHLPTL